MQPILLTTVDSVIQSPLRFNVKDGKSPKNERAIQCKAITHPYYLQLMVNHIHILPLFLEYCEQFSFYRNKNEMMT